MKRPVVDWEKKLRQRFGDAAADLVKSVTRDLGYEKVGPNAYFSYTALRNEEDGSYPNLVYGKKKSHLWDEGYAPYISVQKIKQPRRDTAFIEVEVYAPDGNEDMYQKLVIQALSLVRVHGQDRFLPDPDRDYVTAYRSRTLPSAMVDKYILRLFIVIRRATAMEFEEQQDTTLKSMICDACGTNAPNSQCKGCGDAYYCDESCARDAWTRGQHECKN